MNGNEKMTSINGQKNMIKFNIPLVPQQDYLGFHVLMKNTLLFICLLTILITM